MARNGKEVPIDKHQAIYFRDQLRQARANALRDAEAFDGIIWAVERLGIYLTGGVGGLGAYYDGIVDIARQSVLGGELPDSLQGVHIEFNKLYNFMRVARNDALHQGAFARHLTTHAIQLALVLEDSLMSSADTASEFMVHDPVRAELWQPISYVRQQMLIGSFSYLPVLNSKWQLVSDTNIARYLRAVSTTNQRNKRLAKTLVEAIKESLEMDEAQCCYPDTPISKLLRDFQGKPILVCRPENQQDLVGIITAFDLL